MASSKSYFDSFSVQESDGNFFENFTALSWRQENKRLRATSEDGNDKIPPSELQFAIKPKFQPLNRKEFELLYIEVLYTIKHKIGTTAGGHQPIIQDLYQYAQESFGVSPEDHARLLAKATEEKPPILILNLTVIEAKGLEAKDADGYSDPYCMVGIIPGRLADQDLSNIVFSDDEEPKPKEKEKKSGLRKFSTSLRKKKDPTVKDLLPAKYIRTTIVQPNTLNPVWNEKFRLDHDDEFSVIDAAKKLNEVQSMKGLGRFFKQIAQSARTRSSGSVDDFLGCLTIPLNDLPSTGKDTWYKLEGRSAKSSIQGEIHLKLSLATREDRGIAEDDNWTDVRQHEDLISLFVQHEIRRFQDVPHKWSGNFPKAAKTILHQHAIQGDVTDVQQAIRWMAYSKKHMEYSFSYELLLKLLTDLDEKWTPDSFSREEEELLAESFTTFIDYCVSLIRRQREVFPFSNRAAFTRLENMLRCLAKIYSTKVFRSICPFEKELHSEIGTAIKKGTLEWYDRNSHTSDHEEDTIQRLIELTNTLNSDLHAGYIYYNKLYEGIVSVKYFIILYRQLEKLLGEEFNQSLKKTMNQLEERSKEARDTKHSPIMGTTLFELYLALQEFCSFKEKLPEGVLQLFNVFCGERSINIGTEEDTDYEVLSVV
ncbi:hypothetical protein KUTeg_004507 [Tegillarca granosa]|uniref:C2 domain-containing protein n=1 Tax=Tegillarca granosa TaxID=220873 RepID=A0ABQ9FQ55_TEGGR|nr:hypothetical protein KUTeg_004507 [Tegillarca granosa]